MLLYYLPMALKKKKKKKKKKMDSGFPKGINVKLKQTRLAQI